MTIAEHLAGFIHETMQVPPDVQASAVTCVFDLVGAAIAGYQTPNAQAVRDVADATWGAGPAAIWFSGRRSTAAGAAFANAACACSLDLDDGHRTAAGHPGASVIPGVFAVWKLVVAVNLALNSFRALVMPGKNGLPDPTQVGDGISPIMVRPLAS